MINVLRVSTFITVLIFTCPLIGEDLDSSQQKYFDLLQSFPKLHREGALNDHLKGTYEIVYDPLEIEKISHQVSDRLYQKYITQKLDPAEARKLANAASRVGLVCEDDYWLWIRDAVISPSGFRRTYNRLIWKCNLKSSYGGAAVLPVIVIDGQPKIALELAYRHATSSWELEIPRGAAEIGETAIETAQREMLEETGYVASSIIELGTIAPDSGMTISTVPVFIARVDFELQSVQDETEAIKAKYLFTYAEIMAALSCGYMNLDINGVQTKVPMRDPFLTYALLMAKYKNLL